MGTASYEVTAEGLNVRDEPSIYGRVLTILNKGDRVEFISMSGDHYWYKITTPDGIVGWASHKYLRRIVDDGGASDFPWFAIALAEAGVKEFPGQGANPRITEYLHSTNLGPPDWDEDETPWCSAFVNWCVEQADHAGTDSAWARSWLTWGRDAEQPRTGCIAIFQRNGGGHVGFYVSERETDAGTMITLLGGNQDDEVNESEYPASRLLGYRVPG